MRLESRLEKLEGKISLPKDELVKYSFIVEKGENFDKAMNEVIKESKGLLKRSDFRVGDVNGDKWCFPGDVTIEDVLEECKRLEVCDES